jgi:hypothetical protein
MRYVVLIVLIAVSGCRTSVVTDADKKQSEETARMLGDAHKQVGMPDIAHFTERKLARDILELRDTEGLTTHCYIVNMHGDLIYLGEAIGFGLPYSVQFTNPGRHIDEPDGGDLLMPQADPNGLFMPEGLSATWILLRDPETGKARPVYVEPQIIVSPFRLDHVKRGNGNVKS